MEEKWLDIYMYIDQIGRATDTLGRYHGSTLRTPSPPTLSFFDGPSKFGLDRHLRGIRAPSEKPKPPLILLRLSGS